MTNFENIRRIIFGREDLNYRCNEVYSKYMKAVYPSAKRGADWWDLTTDNEMIGFDRVYEYGFIRDEEVGRFPASWLELNDETLSKTLEDISVQKKAMETKP